MAGMASQPSHEIARDTYLSYVSVQTPDQRGAISDPNESSDLAPAAARTGS